jgi:DNA-binding beta-propeller fold protein YncE
MNRSLKLLLAAAFLAGIPVVAQQSAPEIAFDANGDPLQFPASIFLGEAAGVATNSKGDVFVYTRTGHPVVTLGTSRAFARGGSRLVQFDKGGKFVREIGQDSYGFMFAQQVRVDPQDNIWTVDQMTSMVIKWDPNGQVAMLLGRKGEAIRIPALALGAPAAPAGEGRGAAPAPAPGAAPPAAGAAPAGGGGGRGNALPGAGAQQDVFNRPADVAWDAAGNIYVADGLGNARVAKFDKTGKFVKSWGSRGTGNGQFSVAHGIAIDAAGNVYVADTGNKRIQVFDGDGTFKTQFTGIGNPAAICISAGPRQFLYSSNSNAPDDLESAGEIYKMDLTGRLVGRFGRVGKQLKEFDAVNAIDCRSENELYVGETGNWRVQKVALH